MFGSNVTSLLRLIVALSIILALAGLLACRPAAPPEQPADTGADPTVPAAATEAPVSPAATAIPAPTPQPAAAVGEPMLHMAITPLPQDTYLPWLASQSGHLVFRPMWESLTTIDPRTGVAEVYPQLATDWEISADATEYTFNLRQDVPFHFGFGEFTVKDFTLTIDQQISEQLPGCRGPMRAFMGAESMT